MADIHEQLAYLSEEIGPRPAGTEEEQQAAQYISEAFSAESGLPTTIEDFRCNPDSDLPRVLCGTIAAVVTLFAVLAPFFSVPALIVGILVAALFVLEALDKPVISRFFNKGASQNIVAKYEPPRSAGMSTRHRKVIVVAHYDSGKICNYLKGPIVSALPIIRWVELGAMVLLPILLLIRTVSGAADAGLVVFNILIILCMICALLPLFAFIMNRVAAYSDGANNNASGVAVLLDVAARVESAKLNTVADNVVIHGEQAAEAAGLVPEGAELVYEAEPTMEDELASTMETASERLAAAKAAISALSGEDPQEIATLEEEAGETAEELVVDQADIADVSRETSEEEPVSSPEEIPAELAPSAVKPAAPAAIPVAVPAPAAPAEQDAAVPSWFVKAKQQAKKPTKEKTVQRSRYATAIEAAEENIAARQREAAEEAMRAELMERAERKEAAAQQVRLMQEQVAAVAEIPQKPAPDYLPVVTDPADSGFIPIDTAAAAEAAEAPTEKPAKKAQKDSAEPAQKKDEAQDPATDPDVFAHPIKHSSPDYSIPNPLKGDPDVMVRDTARPLTGSDYKVPEDPTAAAAEETAASQKAKRPSVRKRKSGGRLLSIPAIADAEGVELPDAIGAPEPEQAEPAPERPQRAKRAISLPNIGISQELPRLSVDEVQQAAPLDEAPVERDGRVHDLSAVIPATAEQKPAAAQNDPAAALRNAMPSLANTTSTIPAMSDPSLSGSINLAGAFSSIGATGAAAPVGEELISDTSVEDLYVADADDSDYTAQVTQTGAMAGPGYVDIPKSRFSGIFGKRRKSKEAASTPQQWLNVEEDFDARQVGADRGSWESFRQEDDQAAPSPSTTTEFNPGPGYLDEAFNSDEDDFGGASRRRRRGRHYDGGAFSRLRGKKADEAQMVEGDAGFEGEYVDEEPLPTHHRTVSAGFDLTDLPAGFVFEDAPAAQRIEEFREQRIDMEVWFVALGSELAGNAGMKAFLAEHQADMKGAVILEIEAMGAGNVSLITDEGTYLSKKPSSRAKRIVSKAGKAVGLSIPDATMTWTDSSSACALKHGYQAMHLAGMEGNKPAFYAEADDVLANVDEDQVALNSDLVIEILKRM